MNRLAVRDDADDKTLTPRAGAERQVMGGARVDMFFLLWAVKAPAGSSRIVSHERPRRRRSAGDPSGKAARRSRAKSHLREVPS